MADIENYTDDNTLISEGVQCAKLLNGWKSDDMFTWFQNNGMKAKQEKYHPPVSKNKISLTVTSNYFKTDINVFKVVISLEQKPLGVTIDNQPTFNINKCSMLKNSSQKHNDLKERKAIIKPYNNLQFGYCLLI